MITDIETLIRENLELSQRVAFLEKQLKTDALTGVNSQRELIRICDRREFPNHYLIVAFDIIDFGNFNKHYGHHEGDRILQMFADKLKDVFRFSDYIYRRGGDEFVAILNVSDCSDNLTDIKERLKEANVPDLAYVGFAEGCGYVQELVIEAFGEVEKLKRKD
jgi:diguanylate cyclase (GGDEF)-like protein